MKRNPVALSLTVLVLVLSALPSAHAATAEVLDAKPASLVKALNDAGYKPELRPGDINTPPSIALKVNGDSVYLYFSGCKDGLCTCATASNGFEFPKDRNGLTKVLAGWNAEWYSQAYEDKDGVYLDASYTLTGGARKPTSRRGLTPIWANSASLETDCTERQAGSVVGTGITLTGHSS